MLSEFTRPECSWTPRGSLSVLRIHALSEEPYEPLPALTQAQAYVAVETLRDGRYLAADHGKWSSGGGFTITRIQVTGAGKQALGLWPRFDALGSPAELADILDALADHAPTGEEASNLKTRGRRGAASGARGRP
jgi:hypothetical protein